MLRWLERCTRPEFAYFLNQLAKVANNPGTKAINGCVWALQYLHATQDFGQVLDASMMKAEDLQLSGYADSSFAMDLDNRRSLGAWIMCLGKNVIAHKCKLSSIVAQSSTEAEIYAACDLVKGLLWAKQLLQEVDETLVQGSAIVREDNESCIAWAGNDKVSHLTKHIGYRWHMLKDTVQRGEIDIQYCSTDRMVADVMTKGLGVIKLMTFRANMGIVPREVFDRGQVYYLKYMGWI